MQNELIWLYNQLNQPVDATLVGLLILFVGMYISELRDNVKLMKKLKALGNAE